MNTIITRGGDKGETSLGDGSRIAKSDPRIDLIGGVDELNSWIGVVIANGVGENVRETLIGVQHDLFDLGGALSFPGAPLLSDAHVARLDAAAAALNADLPPLKEFILPGGAPLIAWLHVARAVARRIERDATAFEMGDEKAAPALAYLNRLSDYLFIAARSEARRLGVAESLWERGKSLAAGQSGENT